MPTRGSSHAQSDGRDVEEMPTGSSGVSAAVGRAGTETEEQDDEPDPEASLHAQHVADTEWVAMQVRARNSQLAIART